MSLAPKLLFAVGSLMIAGLIGLDAVSHHLLRTGTAYTAKIMCSEVFLAGRSEEAISRSDFDGIHPLLKSITTHIDYSEGSVESSLFGLGTSRAFVSEGTGCTLHRRPPPVSITPIKGSTDWSEAIDPSVKKVIAQAFASNDVGHRALLVAKGGRLIGEGYGDGFSAETRMQSWSMAKSVTATLIALALEKDWIDLSNPVPIAAWADDPFRSKLTWDDLLRMHGGLEFEENYGDPGSAVNRMLFKSLSAPSISAQSKAVHPPGKRFFYSSGTSNLLAHALGRVAIEHGTSLHQFARENLLAPLGLSNTVLETDASGNFIGSSYVYATPREWLQLGQLFLQKGVWDGVSRFPDGWLEAATSPAPSADGQYGQHLWLNRDGASGRRRFLPGFPQDTYFFSGRDGQYVIIVPSADLVIVRLGITREAQPLPRVYPTLLALYEAARR